jgi:hypothetical protein
VSIRRLLVRASIGPFEGAIAAIIIVQGVVSLGGWGILDPFSAYLPHWLHVTFSVVYLLSGLGITAGLLLPRGDVEGAGLVLLLAAQAARGIMYGAYLKWAVAAVVPSAFSGCIVIASLLRLWVLYDSSEEHNGRG